MSTFVRSVVAAVTFYAASYFARGFLAGQRRFGLYGGLVLMESASRVVFGLLLAVIDAGHDYVGGFRLNRQDSFLRTSASKIINFVRERTTSVVAFPPRCATLLRLAGAASRAAPRTRA